MLGQLSGRNGGYRLEMEGDWSMQQGLFEKRPGFVMAPRCENCLVQSNEAERELKIGRLIWHQPLCLRPCCIRPHTCTMRVDSERGRNRGLRTASTDSSILPALFFIVCSVAITILNLRVHKNAIDRQRRRAEVGMNAVGFLGLLSMRTLQFSQKCQSDHLDDRITIE